MSLTTTRLLLRSVRISKGGQLAMCRKGHTKVLKNYDPTMKNRNSSLSQEGIEQRRTSRLNKERDLYIENLKDGSKLDKQTLDKMREKFPDFLPKPDMEYRDKVKEKLERLDMYRRRTKIDIPEFYVGSIVAVTVSDQYSPGKSGRFLGICIHREGHGLYHSFTLRNVLSGQGIEVTYDMYCPMIQNIEVIKLEKRLDDSLFYLRDCPLEYSTFDPNMAAEKILEGAPIKVNDIKVPLNPHPWSERWERADLKGIQEIEYKTEKLKDKLMKKKNMPVNLQPWKEEDIVLHYRESINPVEAGEILGEVKAKLQQKWK